jgi:hypothetical protein
MATGLDIPMAAEVLARPETSLERALEIEEEFTFRVLDDAGGHPVIGRGAKLSGRRLIAEVSEYVKPDTCVRIDCRDGLLLGETLACWRKGTAIFAAVELLQALTGLEKLATVREERWGLTRPLDSKIRRRA